MTSRAQDVAPWGLVATAVAGRDLRVVRTEAAATWTDGEIVYLGTGDGLDAVMVQASLLAVGSLDPSIVGALLGRRATRSRYVTLEARRAMHDLRHVVPGGVAGRVAAVADVPLTGSAGESLRAAEQDKAPLAPDWFGVIRPLKLMRMTGLEAFQTDDREGNDAVKESDGGDDAEDDVEQGQVSDMSSSSFTTSITSKMAGMLGMGRAARAGMAGTGHEMAIVGDRLGSPSANARGVDAPDWLKVHTGSDYPFGRRYHEWSVDLGAYLSDHCAVAEFDPRMEQDAAPQMTRNDAQLRRQLARLGLADTACRAQPDGDTLDITALVDHAVDRRVGEAAEPRIYERRRRIAHDLGVLVLLDSTGSTGQSTEGQQIFAAQRELAGRLTTVLEELGDRVALYGFNSMGREDVRFLRVKAFGDRYGHAARRRLGALAPSGFTRLGAAVRHGAHLLETDAGTSKMLLVLVGDGLPYEQGYEERYAQEDARRALSEAVAKGIGCACISLRATTDDHVAERVWGHVAHRSFDDPDELAAEVQPLFRHALKEAAAVRRPTAQSSNI